MIIIQTPFLIAEKNRAVLLLCLWLSWYNKNIKRESAGGFCKVLCPTGRFTFFTIFGIIVTRHISSSAVGGLQLDRTKHHRILRYLSTASAMGTGWLNFPVDTTQEVVGLAVANAHEVTIARDGLYEVGALSRLASGSLSSNGIRANIIRGGSVQDWGVGVFNSGNGSVISCHGVLPLLAGDIVSFTVFSATNWTPTGVNNAPPSGDRDRAFINKLWVVEQRA